MYSIAENLLAGIISGFVSSIIVTQIYRKVDKKRDRFEYINELAEYAYEFHKHLFHAGAAEIEDEYIMRLSDFVMKNTLPQKKKWVKLTKEENVVCNDFINFYQKSRYEIWICKLNIQSIQKGEVKYINEVEKSKLNISNIMDTEAGEHWGAILEIRRKYID